MKQTTTAKTLNFFELVSFPDFRGVGKIKAKIDTGAYTGALHCTKIYEAETKDGKILRFSPFDHPEAEISVTDFYAKHVKSSNGGRQKRYIIKTVVAISGGTYPIVLSLADRSEMKWPVLIGRRFLRTNNFLVDVSKKA